MARGMAYKFIRSHPCGMFALNWEIVVNLCEGSRQARLAPSIVGKGDAPSVGRPLVQLVDCRGLSPTS